MPVLIRLDPSRSPLTTSAREKDIKFRPDGDFAAAYIKSYGKGRVAYTTFGHADNNYCIPEFQELYLRLAQFCCGDLKADTTPIPLSGKSVFPPMDNPPTFAQMGALSNLDYGSNDAK